MQYAYGEGHNQELKEHGRPENPPFKVRGIKPMTHEDFIVTDLPFDKPGDTFLIQNYHN